jgi:hypothetical protein
MEPAKTSNGATGHESGLRLGGRRGPRVRSVARVVRTPSASSPQARESTATPTPVRVSTSDSGGHGELGTEVRVVERTLIG